MNKKLISLLLILCLLPAGTVLAADETKTVYTSDFSKDEDGWYGRGAQSFRTAEDTLKTEGRESDWNSPGRDFDLVDGGKYQLSVEVKQDEEDQANFMISVAHSTDGVETYENLAHGTAKKGEWATLTGDYTAGGFDRYVLYVETTGAGTLSFEIRNFTEPPMVIEAVEDLPSLKEIYADKFDFGVAAPQQAFYNNKLTDMILKQYSIVTPENELKPDSVLDVNGSIKLVNKTEDETQVAVHLDAAKPLLDFAKANGLKVHGHVLIWHSQTPESFFHEG